ncbi:MAG TPA: DUF2142 domain-containing protein [Thermoanaerobaculia bacterium]|nr:DUF2142 domain-containing protein [Thermoanaerobaculia bacterium]
MSWTSLRAVDHWWWYAAIALPVAILFAFLTPPFQSPDEVGHYWRANAIARGQLTFEKVDGRPGAMIPADARDLVATLWMELAGKDLKFDDSKFDRARELKPSQELVRVSFPAFYTAVSYMPQSAALFVARVMNVRTLYAFYAGRVLNGIAGIALVMLAMRLLPDAAWVFGAVGLTPMFLFLGGTYSADVVTIGLAFCAIAGALQATRRMLFPLFAGLLSLAKPGYALIALLRLPRIRERKERLPIVLAFLAVAIGGVIAALTARDAIHQARPDAVTDASAQTKVVIAAPLQFVQLAVMHYAQHPTRYTDQLIGRLGWLDVGLPRFVLLAYLAMFLYVALSVGLRVTAIDRAVMFVVIVATLLTVALADYLSWTPVGSDTIEGIQGRYFLPIAPLVLLMISARWLRWTGWVVCAVAVIGNIVALYAVTARY